MKPNARHAQRRHHPPHTSAAANHDAPLLWSLESLQKASAAEHTSVVLTLLGIALLTVLAAVS